MQTSNTNNSPILNSPIVNSPIVNSPIIGSPIITDGSQPVADFNDSCAAGMPAGSRMFYFKFVGILFGILGPLMYGLFVLCERMGWFG